MKINSKWFTIFAWVLCVALAGGLYYIVRDDNKKNAERIAQLQQQANEREQTDNEKLEALTDIYDKFYSQLETQTFVCWGDNNPFRGERSPSFAGL